MKRSWLGVILLSLVLLLSIVFTQQVVNAFFYEKYARVLLFAGGNVLLFPLSLWIYKREKDRA
ncbi:hypothetical protein [Paenibacillus mucilaginosus]|uniref:hypothetical protein n=1 Tax=Paenibacillus mucilaginosus TaxID=61624 RepID=UPI0005A2FA5F|nr:hypothetical protein [Paenibacillus mucilaginosus]MCG7216400.1 hypothetical protein [Paenibacillus mucilaginosus]WDM29234.1 hypothetical protein KCX80_08795 [Paenibacillus mucilaginosus]